MAKLYFRHGTVGSAKTLNLLAVAHNYQQQGKKVLLVKPKIDTRWGEDVIRSRAGLEKKADFVIESDGCLPVEVINVSCILVDEAQFLTPSTIDNFRLISTIHDVPIICYGLRTDFRTRMFSGSQRLLEVADSIEEVKTVCHYCCRKAVFNLKHVNGVPTREGPAIDLGAEEKYFPVCSCCYYEKIK